MIDLKLYTETLSVPGVSKSDKSSLKMIKESKDSGIPLRVKLPVTILDEENLNERIYPTDMMRESIKDAKEAMKNGQLLCTADDHPPTPRPKPVTASHLCVDAFIEEIDGVSYLMNIWEIMKTDAGRNLTALIEAGAAFGVSIRGLGRTDGEEGKGTMKEYMYLGTDAVGDPSANLFTGTRIPNLEILESYKVKESKIYEAKVSSTSDVADYRVYISPEKNDDIPRLFDMLKSNGLSPVGSKREIQVMVASTSQKNAEQTVKDILIKKADDYKLSTEGDAKVDDDIFEKSSGMSVTEKALNSKDFKILLSKDRIRASMAILRVLRFDTNPSVASDLLGDIGVKNSGDSDNKVALSISKKSDKDIMDLFNTVSKYIGRARVESFTNKQKIYTDYMHGHVHEYDPWKGGSVSETDGHTHTYNRGDSETEAGGDDGHKHFLPIQLPVEESSLEDYLESTGEIYRVDSVLITESNKKQRRLVKYKTHDGYAFPSSDFNVETKLEPGVYNILEDMRGIFFEKKTMKSDQIIRFEDSRYNKILSEIDTFWGLAPRFEDLGFTHKRGVLMFGIPGAGKSCLLNQAIEDASSKDTVTFFAREAYSLLRAIETFKEVEPTRNCMVVMEDMDNFSEHHMLQLMDGGDQLNGVLILGTTNYIERLPPRMLRSGRFDTKIEVKAPPIQGRSAYLKSKLSNSGATEEEIEEIAVKTDGFTFAQLRELAVSIYGYGYDVEDSIKRIKSNFNKSLERDLELTNSIFESYKENEDFDEDLYKEASSIVNSAIKRLSLEATTTGDVPASSIVNPDDVKINKVNLTMSKKDKSIKKVQEIDVNIKSLSVGPDADEAKADLKRVGIKVIDVEGPGNDQRIIIFSRDVKAASKALGVHIRDFESVQSVSHDELLDTKGVNMNVTRSVRNFKEAKSNTKVADDLANVFLQSPGSPKRANELSKLSKKIIGVDLFNPPSSVPDMAEQPEEFDTWVGKNRKAIDKFFKAALELGLVSSRELSDSVNHDELFNTRGINMKKVTEQAMVIKGIPLDMTTVPEGGDSPLSKIRVILTPNNSGDYQAIDSLVSSLGHTSLESDPGTVEFLADTEEEVKKFIIGIAKESIDSLLPNEFVEKVKALVSDNKKTDAMRLLIRKEAEINTNSELSAEDLSKSVEELDCLKRDVFGESKSPETYSKRPNTDELKSVANNMDVSIKEARESLKKIEGIENYEEISESINGIIGHITSLESLLSSSIDMLEDSRGDKDKFLKSVSERVGSIKRPILSLDKAFEALDKFRQSEIDEVVEEIDRLDNLSVTHIKLIDDIRWSIKKTISESNVKLRNAFRVIEELRKRFKAIHMIKGSNVTSSKEIAEKVKVIISKNPNLKAFEKELIQSESVDEVMVRAHKYTNIPVTQNSRRLSVETNKSQSKAERLMPSGYR